jgi:hypothetical protein
MMGIQSASRWSAHQPQKTSGQLDPLHAGLSPRRGVFPFRPKSSYSLVDRSMARNMAAEETGPRESFWQMTVHFVRSGSKDSGTGHLPVEED